MYIDSLTYEQFMMLGDAELRRRLSMQDEAEQKARIDREQENETLSLEIKEYISRQEAAELAGVSVSTVTKWMQSGEFQCAGAGKVLRVHRQQFLNWLNEHREGVI